MRGSNEAADYTFCENSEFVAPAFISRSGLSRLYTPDRSPRCTEQVKLPEVES